MLNLPTPQPLILGYVDVGTGQAIASSLGPLLSGILTFFLGLLGYFFIKAKKLWKNFRSRKKSCVSPKKPSSSV